MTTPNHAETGPRSPWHRYLDREHAARNAYLQTTFSAQREYLTGPWPDRESYNAVEHSAWTTYYAAGRAAWILYRQEIEAPPPPPVPNPGLTVPESSNRTIYPAQPYDRDLPAYYPTDGGNQ